MPDLNTRPIHIQVRDVYHNLIQNATIKVIQRKSGKILYNNKSPSGEIILDDIENLKDCHAFRVEIEHPHYKSKPKTNAPCIRGANLNKPHTLEFYYQDKLLVSSVYAEIRDDRDSISQNNIYDTYNTQYRNNIATIQENNNANALYLPQRSYNFDTKVAKEKEAIESLQHIQLHLKAYYNQDSIPNKDKQSQAQKQKYQEQKKETKWGYILFDKEVDIDSKLKELTKDSTIPLTELKEFNRITKEDSIVFINQINEPSNINITHTESKTNIAYAQNNQTSIDSKNKNNINKDFNNTESNPYLLGEEIEIYFKEQWKDKQIRFFLSL